MKHYVCLDVSTNETSICAVDETRERKAASDLNRRRSPLGWNGPGSSSSARAEVCGRI